MRRYGILLASSRFPEAGKKLPDLRCPENDADGVYEVLTRPDLGGFEPETTLVLKNTASHEALKRINQVLRRAGRDDLVIIYYSGHGKQHDVNGHLHLAMIDTDLEALESTSLPVDRLLGLIEVSSCNTVVLVLDCCYSGAVGKFFRSTLGDELQKASHGRGTYLLTASTAVQAAIEKEGDRYGVLTKHIIGGIESGAADRDEDGLITMDELYTYVHERVRDESAQEPELYARARGDVVIARSSRMPRSERRQRARDLLLDLAREQRIPDPLMATAISVLWSQPGQRPADYDRLEHLIDALLLKRIAVPEFVANWFEVSAGGAVLAAAAPAPAPAPVLAEPAPAAAVAPDPAGSSAAKFAVAWSAEAHPRAALACAFSPNGEWLASGAGDGSVFLWNAATGAREAARAAHEGPVWSLTFVPDGHTLITAGGDGSLRWFTVPALEPCIRMDLSEDALLAVACGADTVFAAGHAAELTRIQRVKPPGWSETGSLRAPAGQPATHALVTLAGGAVVSAGSSGRLLVWDASLTNEPRALSFHTSPVLALAFCESSCLLASAGRDARIRLWDTHSWKGNRTLRGHTNSVLALAFDPAGELLASGGADDRLRVWNARTGAVAEEQTTRHDCIHCLSFSATGLLACGGAGGRLEVYRPSGER